MIKHRSVATVVLAAALSFPLVSTAQSQPRIYGSQLMTQQERAEYRTHMRSLRTAQEREQFRFEHHERMQERARARGITLPDEPPARGGRGMGPGGRGMGPGGGAGGPGGR